MTTTHIDALADAALDGTQPVNLREWKYTSRCATPECGKYLFPMYRHHCRFCGDMFCSSCIQTMPQRPLSTGLCSADGSAATSNHTRAEGPVKTCVACMRRVQVREDVYEAMRVLLALAAIGVHYPEWAMVAAKCPATTPMGLAARYLLHTHDAATGLHARAATLGYHCRAIHEELVFCQGPAARFFDLVHGTDRAVHRIAAASPSTKLQISAWQFLSVMHRAQVDARWIAAQFSASYGFMWACVFPLVHPLVRKRAAQLLGPLQKRVHNLNCPPPQHILTSKSAVKCEKSRSTMERVLRALVLCPAEAAKWWRSPVEADSVVAHTPSVYYGTSCLPLMGASRNSDPQSPELAANLVLGDTGVTVLARFTDCGWDVLRASAFADPDTYADHFVDQLGMNNGPTHWKCIMTDGGARSQLAHATSRAAPAAVPFDVAGCSQRSVDVQCLLLTLLQAGHRRRIDVSKLRAMTVDDVTGTKKHLFVYHVEFLPNDADHNPDHHQVTPQNPPAVAVAESETDTDTTSTEEEPTDACPKPSARPARFAKVLGGWFDESTDGVAAGSSDPPEVASEYADVRAQRQHTQLPTMFTMCREMCYWAYRLMHVYGRCHLTPPPLPATVAEFLPYLFTL